MKNTLTFLLILLLAVQATAGDWGSSLGADVTKKILPKLSVSLEEEFRTRSDFSRIDRFSTSLELGYKPFSFLKVGGAYNLINLNHEKKGWEIRHRYYFFATGSYSFGDFSVSLRERFQSTKRQGVKETEKRANPKLFLRSRLKVEYNIPKCKLEPYISAELYQPLNDKVSNKLEKVRYMMGTSYKLNKKNSFDFFYRYTNYTGDDDDDTDTNMIGIGYSFKF